MSRCSPETYGWAVITWFQMFGGTSTSVFLCSRPACDSVICKRMWPLRSVSCHSHMCRGCRLQNVRSVWVIAKGPATADCGKFHYRTSQCVFFNKLNPLINQLCCLMSFWLRGRSAIYTLSHTRMPDESGFEAFRTWTMMPFTVAGKAKGNNLKNSSVCDYGVDKCRCCKTSNSSCWDRFWKGTVVWSDTLSSFIGSLMCPYEQLQLRWKTCLAPYEVS